MSLLIDISYFCKNKIFNMDKKRILVVDDEETLCEVLKFNLEVEGYDVDVAYSAEQALQLDLTSYSLILLDVMMGEISGFSMARMLRNNPATSSIPIIFCTAKSTEDEMVAGLNLGGDDYITKPYSIRNVLARVKSVLRRAENTDSLSNGDTIVYKTLVIDRQSKRLTVDGEIVSTTKKELEILTLLVSNIGRIYSRDEILSLVWKNEVIVLDRTVDVNITRLRKKIGRYGNHIVTRLGYGYGFEE